MALLSLLPLVLALFGQDPDGILSTRYPEERVTDVLLERAAWKPVPRIGESGWDIVPEHVRQLQIHAGEAWLGKPWPSLPASVFLDFARNGNRSRYQALCFGRRERLATLVLAELFEDEGRFLDDIVDGTWLVCEETYWGVPAHVGAQARGEGLPDVQEPTVDLFAAETGALLAWTHYLLHDRLDRVSELVRERIAFEVQRRILVPCREREDFWWMGYGKRRVNNWNPWICSNWLTAVLLLEPDEAQRARDVSKVIRVLDHFLAGYPADGGCDEGPGYWSRAGGSLFDSLELLASASQGSIDVFQEPLVQAIGRYIMSVHLADDWFVNFADASARTSIDAALVYRYGRAIGDAHLMSFATAQARRQKLGTEPLDARFGSVGRALHGGLVLAELQANEPSESHPLDAWFPDLEVMVARRSNDPSRGFAVAAKGGHNDESHNHNDVGNVIVFHDGHPVLVDAGVGTYTKQTFSSRRYAIWTMQSAYHNLPTLNGAQQRAGRSFRARDVTHAVDDGGTTFALELAGAYPNTAGIRSFQREVRLDRADDQIVMRDHVELEPSERRSTWNLLTSRSVDVEPGRLVLRTAGAASVELRYAPADLHVLTESIALDDDKLRHAWPGGLTRIVFAWPDGRRSGDVTFTLVSAP
ncbi:MAG: heparinase II/III family protein [Planctomycetes bacterium]|nr:heparinase II/III family protein [Planctomycetota bacterium]